VTAEGDPSQGSLLRELVEDTGSYCKEEMEDVGSESSGISELESEEEEKEWDQKDSGRPNFKHATPGAEQQQQSTSDFFQHGNGTSLETYDSSFFATPPGKQAMRGALAHSLSAGARSPQQVGSALTLNSARDSSEGVRIEGGQEFNRVGCKEAGGREEANLIWAEEVPSVSEDEMEDVVGPEQSTTPTPMSARWVIPTAVPVTPSNGNEKRVLAVSTLKSIQAVP